MMGLQQMGNLQWIAHSENGLMMSHIGNCHGVEGMAEKNHELREEGDTDMGTDMEGNNGKSEEDGDNLKVLNVRLKMVVVGMLEMEKSRQNCIGMDMDMKQE